MRSEWCGSNGDLEYDCSECRSMWTYMYVRVCERDLWPPLGVPTGRYVKCKMVWTLHLTTIGEGSLDLGRVGTNQRRRR